MITHREFLASPLLAVGLRSSPGSGRPGQLRARPGRLSATSHPGRYSLGLAAGRDGLLYVPAGYQGDRRVPLVVMLHGAGGQAKISESFAKLADDYETVVLAPDSRRGTWDAILGQMGPDVEFIDAALAHVFARCAVDPGRLAIAGFSD